MSRVHTPTLHFDYVMRTPGASEFHALIDKQFFSFSDEELLGGKIPEFVNNLDAVTRISTYLMQLYKRFGQNTYATLIDI